jgi:hypothetical protein
MPSESYIITIDIALLTQNDEHYHIDVTWNATFDMSDMGVELCQDLDCLYFAKYIIYTTHWIVFDQSVVDVEAFFMELHQVMVHVRLGNDQFGIETQVFDIIWMCKVFYLSISWTILTK